MSNPVTDAVSAVTKGPKQVISWAKAKPWVFALLLLAAFMIAIRYRNTIVKWLVGIKVLGIGAMFARFLRVGTTAAVALGAFLAAGHALAATPGGSVSSGGGVLGWVLGLLAVSALGMAWNFPVPDIMDLKTGDGDTQVAITPGTSEAQKTFKVTAPKGQHAGGWIKATSIVGRLRVGVDQPSSGGSTINWDQLPRVIAGLEITSPLFGTMLNKETGSGPILKHLIEFVGNGYAYAGDGARAQIASADGDTAVDLYFTYPLALRYLVRPHDTAFWIGHLDQTLLNFFLNTTTALDSVSTGAVIEATTNLQMGLEYVIDNDFEVPVCPYWHLYTHNAGSKMIKLLSVGAAGPKNTRKFERIAGVFELLDIAGMGGPDGADNITQFYCPQLGMDRIVNIDFLFKRYLALVGYPRGPKGGNGSNALHDVAGNPYTMAATPSGVLNDANAMYLPIKAPSRETEITKLPKFFGDLEITQEYTSTPSSGSHRVLIASVREFEPAFREELKVRAGRGGRREDVPLADGQSVGEAGGSKTPRKFLGLPRSVK